MSDSFDPYLAWLDFTACEHAPGYYGLLGLACFEADKDRIEQAIMHASMGASAHLRGPNRALAEAALEEVNRAEACLMDSVVKAAYDARLRGLLCSVSLVPNVLPPPETPLEQPKEPLEHLSLALDDEPLDLPELVQQVAPPAGASTQPLEAKSAALSPPASRGRPAPNDAAASADRMVLAAIQNAQRSTKKDTGKKAAAESHAPVAPSRQAALIRDTASPSTDPQRTVPAPDTRISLVAALLDSLFGPLAKHIRPLAAGLLVLLSLGAVYSVLTRMNDVPPTPRQRIVLSDEETFLATQQINALYDLTQDTATRAAAADKLRALSPSAVKKFNYRLNDLAEKQPEEAIQQTLQSILASASPAQ